MVGSIPGNVEITGGKPNKYGRVFFPSFMAQIGVPLSMPNSNPEYVDFFKACSVVKNFDTFVSLDQFLMNMKTKAFTYTRLSRCLTHILTNQRKSNLDIYADSGYAFYIRVLGFRKESAALFQHIKRHTSLPLITKLSNYKVQLNTNGKQMIEEEIFACELYRMVSQIKYGSHLKNEFNESIVII